MPARLALGVPTVMNLTGPLINPVSYTHLLTQFNYMPVFGVATATVMLVARSLGEGDLEQLDRLRKQSYWLSFVFMLPIALGIFFGGTLLTHLYTQDTKAVEASLSVVLFSLLGTPFRCV